MEFILEKNPSFDKRKLIQFLNNFWFIPSDALQRSLEASIWTNVKFRKPVLDIGVGNGGISKLLFGKREIDYGIDVEEEELKEAKKVKIYNHLVTANAEKMPFKNNMFNTVISNSTFEHIKKDKEAVREVARVLKKNGYFIFTVPSSFLPRYIRKTVKNNQDERLQLFNKRANHQRYRSKKDWIKILEENNLKTVLAEYYFNQVSTAKWYELFKLYTSTVGKREVWSLVGNSKLSRFFPQKLSNKFFLKYFLKKIDKKLFIKEGSMLFFIAQKK